MCLSPNRYFTLLLGFNNSKAQHDPADGDAGTDSDGRGYGDRFAAGCDAGGYCDKCAAGDCNA